MLTSHDAKQSDLFVKNSVDSSRWPLGSGFAYPGRINRVGGPWPPETATVTGLVELIALVLIYQRPRNDARTRPSVLGEMCSCGWTIVVFVYLTTFSIFTFLVPTTGELGIDGLFVPRTRDSNIAVNVHL
jgi:hypothetical protein